MISDHLSRLVRNFNDSSNKLSRKFVKGSNTNANITKNCYVLFISVIPRSLNKAKQFALDVQDSWTPSLFGQKINQDVKLKLITLLPTK